jgi:hypothetical protein
MKPQISITTVVTALAGFTASLPAHASLVAAWDFQTGTNGGTVLTTPAQKVFNSNFGSGTLFLNGSYGSSDFVVNAVSGTALNADAGLGMSTITSSPAAINVEGNLKAMVFRLDMRQFSDLSISFAVQRSNRGFTSQLWEVSTNGSEWAAGSDWTAIATVSNINNIGTGASFGLKTISAGSALDGVRHAYVRVTFSGATAANGYNQIDNIRMTASVIPGPGALGLASLAVVFSRRRRA